MLQNVNFSYQNNQELILLVFTAKSDLMCLWQSTHQSVQDYYEKFMALKEVNESVKNSIHEDPGLLELVVKEHGDDIGTH